MDHYCGGTNDVEPNFVQLKHRQIWEDILSFSEVVRDGKTLTAFESGDVPNRRILLTVSRYQENITNCLICLKNHIDI